jgi:hypothetical protein
MQLSLRLTIILYCVASVHFSTHAFSIVTGSRVSFLSTEKLSLSSSPLFATSTNDENNEAPGDRVRLANNVRPSLNPTVINTISNALLQRSTTKSSFIPTSTTKPIDIMVQAGSLASVAIQNRAKSSMHVDGDDGAFNLEESKLVAGRIVGVMMRLHELEDQLIERVKGVGWIKKYGEESSFGVCKVELDEGYSASLITNAEISDDDDQSLSFDPRINQVLMKLGDDPLLRMCRAECLYALFLKNVEMPSMAKAGQIPIDTTNLNGNGSGIDFLDQERMEVLFPDGFE